LKLISFFYFSVYNIVKRTVPHKEPKKTAIGDISAALNFFIVPITLIGLFQTELWLSVIRYWSPDFVEPSKYNLFSPAAVLMLLTWFFVKKSLNWYFSKPNCMQKLDAYYGPKKAGEIVNTYDNHGRFLIAFFSLGGFITVLLYIWKGLTGLLLILGFLLLYEFWIRYEFQWRIKH